MGFVTRSLILMAGLFILYAFVNILHGGGIDIFGQTFYTELGFFAFMAAIFFDTTFSFHKW